MRYQNPIVNPFSQYWEEEFIFGWLRRYWTRLLANVKYFAPDRLLVKRVMDILGAIIGIILASPIFLLVPVLIKLDSRGPVFYRQERIGWNRRRSSRRNADMPPPLDRRSIERRRNTGFGKPFMIIKFRTMFTNAERESGPVWAKKKDPRVTRVGSLLRITRIDELPQLFNVLKGDMSLVGPRPERQFFVARLKDKIDQYETRLLVKPGITGLAQVVHKYDESLDDARVKVKYDIAYVRDLTIIKDIKIILRTILVVLAAKGM